MMRKTPHRILGGILPNLLLVACTEPTAVPTLTLVSTPTPYPTLAPQPVPPSTPTLSILTVVASPPTRTATRTPLPTRTRILATVTRTSAPLEPLVWDARLDALGIKYVPTTAKPGEVYWRLIQAEFWDEKESQASIIFSSTYSTKTARVSSVSA
jgi:hypothetical protein